MRISRPPASVSRRDDIVRSGPSISRPDGSPRPPPTICGPDNISRLDDICRSDDISRPDVSRLGPDVPRSLVRISPLGCHELSGDAVRAASGGPGRSAAVRELVLCSGATTLLLSEIPGQTFRLTPWG
jgi:hypothetical protein